MVFRGIPLVMAALVGLVAVGAIVAIALLLSSERGRTVLKALLIVPALVLVVALLTLFSYRAASYARHQTEARRSVQQQQLQVQRAEVHRAMAEATAHFEEAISRLDQADPQVHQALAEASGRLHEALRELDGPAPQAHRAMAEAQARLQEQLVRINRPSPEIDRAFAEMSAKIEGMRVRLEEHQRGRPVQDAVALADNDPTEEAETPKSAENVEESGEEGPAPKEAAEEETAADETSPAEDRPEWVDATPRKLGSVYQMKVDVFADPDELDRELPKALQQGVDKYVATHRPRARGKIRLPLDYIQSKVVKGEWKETLQVQITPQGQKPERYVPTTHFYVLLEFDHEVNARIEEEWDRVVVTERLFGVGSLAGMVLMLLAGVYAYLKIALATGGRYRARLRLAAAAALLIAILAGLMLSVV